MDSAKALEMLEKKLEENTKAHKEMLEAVERHDSLEDIVKMCDNYFMKILKSNDDKMFKAAYNNYCTYIDGQTKAQLLLEGIYDDGRDDIRREIIDDCEVIDHTLKKLIDDIKKGKDIEKLCDEIKQYRWNWSTKDSDFFKKYGHILKC